MNDLNLSYLRDLLSYTTRIDDKEFLKGLKGEVLKDFIYEVYDEGTISEKLLIISETLNPGFAESLLLKLLI